MADDAERAAKAARAKAMLEKRRKAKAATNTTTNAQVPSRTSSPAPVHAPPTPVLSPPPPPSPKHKDVSSLFGDSSGGAAVDFEEFGVISPPSPHKQLAFSPSKERKQAFSPPPPTPPPQGPSKEELELRTLVEDQKKTIQLLVDEKVSLSAQLEGVEEMERRYADVEAQLEKTKALSKDLVGRLKVAEEEREGTARRLEEVVEKERVVAESARDMELELEDARQTTNDLRSRLQESERKLRALEEDDRAETLERNLKASQDRATELELQIGKMKQNLTSITSGRDEMNRKIDDLMTTNERILQEKTELQHELDEFKASHMALSSSHTDSEQARSSLESELEISQATVVSLQHQVSQLSSDLASHARQLNEARNLEAEAKARADDAERAKNDLQAENSGLLAQLEEMRPKVVELSNKNAEDEERVWKAEKRVQGLEREVERLEGLLEERNGAAEDAEVRVRVLEDEMKKREGKHADELRTLGESVGETQVAHAGLAHELAASKEVIERLEAQVGELKKAAKERKHEVQRVKEELKNREAETELLRGALETTQAAEQDAVAMVQRSQADVESLRDQLALREDEIARLRETEGSMASQSPRVPQASFSEELLSNLRQQHALDMSTSHSRIRELETAVFDAEASAHAFQRKVTQLEEELLQLRTKSALGSPTRPTSERHSISSARPHTPLRRVLAPRPVYEANLSAETRHKRKVSLSMLKARIESERTAAATLLHSPALSHVPISEADESLSGGAHTPKSDNSHSHSHSPFVRRQPDVFDDTHVFWCHSCKGDLVVL
ncbi:hypothetical protein M422DRAFT_214820 [Sphaerobolus stellatus SS14]|uniref:Uncharacterized protein n=1 Tax=Sphaerobolus stellatus (strain SS14) TaxID=990650 RepID=A0A0C9U6C1_SPHS4|nr:hypothetical protein M422DRAFT_214820 [Sphaerobolus stellatus SS14]